MNIFLLQFSLFFNPVRGALLIVTTMTLTLYSVASYSTGEHHHDTAIEHDEPLKITAAMAAEAGITVATARAGTIQQQLKLFAQISADPEQTRALTARFPGVIRAVNVRLGAQVQAGDILASVEANESLRRYNITAPVAGMVVARAANIGEATDTRILFTLANYQQLVANIAVFPRDAAKIKVAQLVRLHSDNADFIGTINTLIPNPNATPTITARVAIDNSYSQWSVGEWVSAHVAIAEIPVRLLVDNRALHELRETQVVFVQVADTYEPRVLKLGVSDGQFTEVIDGLNEGDRYVVENSYLLKADLEKSGASHNH